MSQDDDEKDNLDDTLDRTSVVQSETFKVRIAQAGQAPPCIVLLVGPAASVGRQWPIEDTDRVIGRADGAHIQVDDRSMSKSHAKLVMAGGDVSIIDLGSTNKTVVNGKVVTPLIPLKLKNNDQIKTGNVIFKYLEQGNIETVSTAQTFDRALTDPLTGANNRGALNQKGPDSFRKAGLLGIPMTVIVFDIDHFKVVNDTYGHPAGDFVLQEISRIIRERLIRENDFFARSGGEEFCVLLLGGNVNQSSDVAERIRHTIEVHDFTFQGRKMAITISLGVATNKVDDHTWEQIYERADQALYKSKNNGRNRVTLAP